MKNLWRLFSMLLVIVVLQSCDELLDPPSGDNTQDDKVERLKWKVDFDEVAAASLLNPVPAVDPSGNVYVLADVKDIPGATQIMKISPSGEKLWSVREKLSVASRIMYQDEKLYFIISNTLFCLNAADGTELWSVAKAATYNIIAMNNERIYLTRWQDTNVVGRSFIDAYDLSGNRVWSHRIFFPGTDSVYSNNFPYTMSLHGNQIYLGVLAEVGDAEFGIIAYQDNGDAPEEKWNWLAPDNFSSGNQYYFRDFAIDNDNNLLFRLTNDGVQYIFSVSENGITNWSAASGQQKEIVDVSINGEGDFFTAFDKVEKLSSAGDIWTSEAKKDWDYEGLAAQAPIITQNGNIIYSNNSAILSLLKADGSLEWEQYIYPCDICTEEFHNIALTPGGDIIVVGKFRVYCFEGDGSGLPENAWAKTYGDYGNTANKP